MATRRTKVLRKKRVIGNRPKPAVAEPKDETPSLEKCITDPPAPDEDLPPAPNGVAVDPLGGTIVRGPVSFGGLMREAFASDPPPFDSSINPTINDLIGDGTRRMRTLRLEPTPQTENAAYYAFEFDTGSGSPREFHTIGVLPGVGEIEVVIDRLMSNRSRATIRVRPNRR